MSHIAKSRMISPRARRRNIPITSKSGKRRIPIPERTKAITITSNPTKNSLMNIPSPE